MGESKTITARTGLGERVAASQAWLEEAARLIERVDGEAFVASLVETLERTLPIEMVAVFLYRGRSRPLCLFENFPTPRAKAGIANYIESSYVLNPFYQAHLQDIEEGVYRIRDLAPDAYLGSTADQANRITITDSEEIGFITHGWPEGLEEIELAISLEPTYRIEFGLYRPLSQGGFADADLALLEALRPFIGALLRKHWALRRHHLASAPLDTRLDDALEGFGRGTLSAREREVMRFVLRGHSSESIGYNLGISLTTVKTHRKRAYAKLGIASQNELFSLFLTAVGSGHGAEGPIA